MSRLGTRAITVGLIGIASIAVIVGAAVAGAMITAEPHITQTQPTPRPQEVDVQAASVLDASREDLEFRVGSVVSIGQRGFAMATQQEPEPFIVRVRSYTKIWLEREPAALDALKPGDRVAVVGHISRRGNLMGRSIHAHRSAS